MKEWQHPRYVAVPVPTFKRTLERLGVSIEPAKRQPPGTFEFQRSMLVTWLYIDESEACVPPWNVESVCDQLEIQMEDFYAEAMRLMRADNNGQL